ncbi:DUF3299 domain-containing protein [Chitinophaga agrisoli]|uniref:DUF3299 domain-containing protein n=1 Tax=Chitinophaga agrisoli TaxID=2607653 RepID=A0A5B2VZ84_9BACT|nr:DUF3299 domain-containing protein [Chitinophaga agrisoli]KAA2244771.1 DUF3299 domain-containing protein [Chitinophaga agrisoli]
MFSSTQRYLLAAGAFLLVSCTDISRFCRHNGNGYLQRWLAARAAGIGNMGEGIGGNVVKAFTVGGINEQAHIVTAVGTAGDATEIIPVDGPLLAGANAVSQAVLPVAPSVHPAREQDQPPRSVTWRQLKDVVFNRIWDEKMDMPMLYPQFSRGIKSLNGAYIRIAGYVIPLDVNGGIYVLSANPNNACFFCGGAGPESVMALKLKPGHARFKTDDYLTFTGKLRLNEKNIYELYYNLDGAAIAN